MYYKAIDYENFSNKLLERTKKLGVKPSEEDVRDYLVFIRENFKIKNEVELEFIKNSEYDGGCYVDCNRRIIIYKNITLIKVLHEIRHFIQFNTHIKEILTNYEDRELDARAWSSSLFYSLFPEEYLSFSKTDCIKYI